jgi:hypothetical protein
MGVRLGHRGLTPMWKAEAPEGRFRANAFVFSGHRGLTPLWKARA